MIPDFQQLYLCSSVYLANDIYHLRHKAAMHVDQRTSATGLRDGSGKPGITPAAAFSPAGGYEDLHPPRRTGQMPINDILSQPIFLKE